jgi:L-threonylcarbamoyladenylate synthase
VITDNIKTLSRQVQEGGIIAYPTEAVFGLGCDPDNEAAVKRLLQLKQRSADKGLILIASDYSQVAHYLQPLEAAIEKKVFQTWPGPVTWILPKSSDTPACLSGKYNTLAVRITAHEPVRQLCHELGHALVSTSANLSGQPPAKTLMDVRRQFEGKIDGILDNPLGGLERPTAIYDGITGDVIRSA